MQMQGEVGPGLCISPRSSPEAVRLYDRNAFPWFCIELSGSLDRSVVTHTFPLPRYTVCRLRGLFYDFSPPKLNLFYISHGRAKHLWVFWLPELVVDQMGAGLYLLRNERTVSF